MGNANTGIFDKIKHWVMQQGLLNVTTSCQTIIIEEIFRFDRQPCCKACIYDPSS